MKREQTIRTVLAVLLIALVGLYVYWYFNQEWVEEEIDLGPSDEALRNPFLGAQKLAEENGLETYFQRGFSGLGDLTLSEQNVSTQDTLVLINTYQSLPESHVNALLGWVENGGNLVVTATNPFMNANDLLDDPLLGQLNLVLDNSWNNDYTEYVSDEEQHSEEHDENATPSPVDSDEAQSESENTAWQPNCYYQSQVEINLPDQKLPFDISASNDARLYNLDDYYNEGKEQLQPFYYKNVKLGAGQAHVFAGHESLLNENIACFNNAIFFWNLISNSKKVWFAVNASSPNFWQELWRLSAVGCTALLLALAFWVWQQAVRFGPIFNIDRSERRNFIDHIKASATFLYRNEGTALVIETLRKEINQCMQYKHSHFNRLNPKEQLEKYQQASNMSAEDIEKAMFQPLPVPGKSFIGCVRRLQHLRNSL